MAAEVALGAGLVLYDALVRGDVPGWLVQNLAVSIPAFGILPFWIVRRHQTFGPDLMWKLGSDVKGAGFEANGSFVVLYPRALVLEITGNLVAFRRFLASDGPPLDPTVDQAVRWCRWPAGRRVVGSLDHGRADHALAARVDQVRGALGANWGLLQVVERRVWGTRGPSPSREVTLTLFIPRWREHAEAIGEEMANAREILDQATALGLPERRVHRVPRLLARGGEAAKP